MTKRLALVALLLACSMAAVAQGKKAVPADPWAGTWKLDASKSKFHTPGPTEETLTVDAATKDSVKYSMKGTGPDGAYTEAYEGKADGNPYPLTRNGQEVAKISYHRDSDHHSTGKATVVDGSTFTEEAVLSKDGKTITVTQHHKAKDGNYDDVIVFTRQ